MGDRPEHGVKKLFADGLKPTLRQWLVFFLIGFVLWVLMEGGLCFLKWLASIFGKAIAAPIAEPGKFSRLAILPAVATRATVCGALLATAMMFEARRKQQEKVEITGHHPLFGKFAHLPYFKFKVWRAEKIRVPSGVLDRLYGAGPAPTHAQAALWERFISNFDSTIRSAAAALLLPGRPFHGCQSLTLTLTGASFREDGNLDLSFDHDTVPENFRLDPHKYHPAHEPRAIFTPDLTLVEAGWD